MHSKPFNLILGIGLLFATTLPSYALVITGKVYELPDMIPSHHAMVFLSNVHGHGTTTDQHGHFTLKITDQIPENIDLEITSVYRIGIKISHINIANMDTLHLEKLHIFKPDRKTLPKFVSGNTSASAINNKHKIPKVQHVMINRKQYEMSLDLKEERYELEMEGNK